MEPYVHSSKLPIFLPVHPETGSIRRHAARRGPSHSPVARSFSGGVATRTSGLWMSSQFHTIPPLWEKLRHPQNRKKFLNSAVAILQFCCVVLTGAWQETAQELEQVSKCTRMSRLDTCISRVSGDMLRKHTKSKANITPLTHTFQWWARLHIITRRQAKPGCSPPGYPSNRLLIIVNFI